MTTTTLNKTEMAKHDLVLGLYQVGNFLQRADAIRYLTGTDCRLSLTTEEKFWLHEKLRNDAFGYGMKAFRTMEFSDFLRFAGKSLIEQADDYADRNQLEIKKGVRKVPKTTSNMFAYFQDCFKSYATYEKAAKEMNHSQKQSFDWHFSGLHDVGQLVFHVKNFMRVRNTLLTNTGFRRLEKVLFEPMMGGNLDWWRKGYPCDVLVWDVQHFESGDTGKLKYVVNTKYCASHIMEAQTIDNHLKASGNSQDFKEFTA